MANGVNIPISMPVGVTGASQAAANLNKVGNAADRTTQLINRVSNSAVQFSKIVGQSAHSAQQSFLQVDNRLRILERSMMTAATSANTLSRNLTALSHMATQNLGVSQFAGLNRSLQDAGRNAQVGVGAMNQLRSASEAAGTVGSRAIAGISASTASAVAGVVMLSNYVRTALQQMERMDTLRASYQRIVGARPDISGSALGSSMDAFWKNSVQLAYQYGAAIDDVAGTMIEFARQGHSPSVVQYLTKELAELRLMLATSTGDLVDMRSAMGSVITLMNQMGVDALDAVDGLKLIAEYDIRTATSFNEISAALNRFAASGKVAGMSMQEMIQTATAFTEIGIKGGRAGTALNTILARVVTNKNAVAMMNDLGVSLTTVENGATRATSTMERLLEAYLKVKATGNKKLLQDFGYSMAGARQWSVLFAGLEQLAKQTKAQVTPDQFNNLTSVFSQQLLATLQQAPLAPEVKVKLDGNNIDVDSDSVRQRLIERIQPLMKELQDEFASTGKMAVLDDDELAQRLLGGRTTIEQAHQFTQVYSDAFRQVRAEWDSLASAVESRYDNVARLALSTSDEMKKARAEQLASFQNTLLVQRTRATNAFQESFLNPSSIKAYGSALEYAVGMMGRLGNTISTVMSFMTGWGTGIKAIGVLVEMYLSAKLIDAFGRIGTVGNGIFASITGSVSSLIQDTGQGLTWLLNKYDEVVKKQQGLRDNPDWALSAEGIWAKYTTDTGAITRPFETAATLVEKFQEAVAKTQVASTVFDEIAESVTGANNRIEALMSPTSTLKEQLAEMNVTSLDASRAWREFTEAMEGTAVAVQTVRDAYASATILSQPAPSAQVEQLTAVNAELALAQMSDLDRQAQELQNRNLALTESFRQVADATRDSAEALAEMGRQARDVSTNNIQEFTRFLNGLEFDQEAIKSRYPIDLDVLDRIKGRLQNTTSYGNAMATGFLEAANAAEKVAGTVLNLTDAERRIWDQNGITEYTARLQDAREAMRGLNQMMQDLGRTAETDVATLTQALNPAIMDINKSYSDWVAEVWKASGTIDTAAGRNVLSYAGVKDALQPDVLLGSSIYPQMSAYSIFNNSALQNQLQMIDMLNDMAKNGNLPTSMYQDFMSALQSNPGSGYKDVLQSIIDLGSLAGERLKGLTTELEQSRNEYDQWVQASAGRGGELQKSIDTSISNVVSHQDDVTHQINLLNTLIAKSNENSTVRDTNFKWRDLTPVEMKGFEDAAKQLEQFTFKASDAADFVEKEIKRLTTAGRDADALALRKLFDELIEGADEFGVSCSNAVKILRDGLLKSGKSFMGVTDLATFFPNMSDEERQEQLKAYGLQSTLKDAVLRISAPQTTTSIRLDDIDTAVRMGDAVERLLTTMKAYDTIVSQGRKMDFGDSLNLASANTLLNQLNRNLQSVTYVAEDAQVALQGMTPGSDAYVSQQNYINSLNELRTTITSVRDELSTGISGENGLFVGDWNRIIQSAGDIGRTIDGQIMTLNKSSEDAFGQKIPNHVQALADLINDRLTPAMMRARETSEQLGAYMSKENRQMFTDEEFANLGKGVEAYRNTAEEIQGIIDRINTAIRRGEADRNFIPTVFRQTRAAERTLDSYDAVAMNFGTADWDERKRLATKIDPNDVATWDHLREVWAQMGNNLDSLERVLTGAQEKLSGLTLGTEAYAKQEAYVKSMQDFIDKIRELRSELEQGVSDKNLDIGRAEEIQVRAQEIAARTSQVATPLSLAQTDYLQTSLVNAATKAYFEAQEAVDALSQSLMNMAQQRDSSGNRVFSDELLSNVNVGREAIRQTAAELPKMIEEILQAAENGEAIPDFAKIITERVGTVIEELNRLKATASGNMWQDLTIGDATKISDTVNQLEQFQAKLREVQDVAANSDFLKSAEFQAMDENIKALIPNLGSIIESNDKIIAQAEIITKNMGAPVDLLNSSVLELNNALKDTGDILQTVGDRLVWATEADYGGIDKLKSDLASVNERLNHMHDLSERAEKILKRVGLPKNVRQEVENFGRALNTTIDGGTKLSDKLRIAIGKLQNGVKLTKEEVTLLNNEMQGFNTATGYVEKLEGAISVLAGKIGLGGIKGFIDGIVGGFFRWYTWATRIVSMCKIIYGWYEKIAGKIEDWRLGQERLNELFEEQARQQKRIADEQKRAEATKEQFEKLSGEYRDNLVSFAGEPNFVALLADEARAAGGNVPAGQAGNDFMAQTFDNYRTYLENYFDRANELAKEGRNLFEEEKLTSWIDFMGKRLGLEGQALADLADKFQVYFNKFLGFDIMGGLKAITDLKKQNIEDITSLITKLAESDKGLDEAIAQYRENFSYSLRSIEDTVNPKYVTLGMGDTVVVGMDQEFRNAARDKAFGSFRYELNAALAPMNVDMRSATIDQLDKAFQELQKKAKDAPDKLATYAHAIEVYAEELGQTAASIGKVSKQAEEASKALDSRNQAEAGIKNLTTPNDMSDLSARMTARLKNFEARQSKWAEGQKDVDKLKSEIDELKADDKTKEAAEKTRTLIALLEERAKQAQALHDDYIKIISESRQEQLSSLLSQLEDKGLLEGASDWSAILDATQAMTEGLTKNGEYINETADLNKAILESQQKENDAWIAWSETILKIKEDEEKAAAIIAENEKILRDTKDLTKTQKDDLEKAIRTAKDTLKDCEDRRDDAKKTLDTAIASAKASLQAAIDTLFNAVDRAGKELITSVMSKYGIAIDSVNKWASENIEGYVPIKKPEKPAAPKTPETRDARSARENAEAGRIQTVKTTVENGTELSKEQTKRERELQNQVDQQGREIKTLKRQLLNTQKQRSRGGSRGRQKDPNKDLLQELLHEFQEREDDLKMAYQVIRDSEGNITKYLDRTNSDEYLQKQIELLQQKRDKLKDLLSKPGLSDELRRKTEKEITKTETAEVKIKLILDTREWNIQKAQAEQDIKLLEDDLSQAQELDNTSQQVSILEQIWQKRKALYDEELKKIKEEGDSEKIFRKEIEGVNMALEQQGKIASLNLQKFKKYLDLGIKQVTYQNLNLPGKDLYKDFMRQYPELFTSNVTTVITSQIGLLNDTLGKFKTFFDSQKAKAKADYDAELAKIDANAGLSEAEAQAAKTQAANTYKKKLKYLSDALVEQSENAIDDAISKLKMDYNYSDTLDMSSIAQALGLNIDGLSSSMMPFLNPTEYLEQAAKISQEWGRQYAEQVKEGLIAGLGHDPSEEELAEIEQQAQAAGATAAEKMNNKFKEGLAQAAQKWQEEFKSAWDEGFEIGLEYGFTSEGYDKLIQTFRKKIASIVSKTLQDTLTPVIQSAFQSVMDQVTKYLQSAMKPLGNAAQQFGSLITGMLTQIATSFLGMAIGFLIGGVFSDFTSAIEEQAEAQLKQQRDSINAQGFSWSYGGENTSTPYYEFSPPVTNESTKIVKFSNTFNITTDAALAMASHRRELERVCTEIIEQYTRAAAKTVGATI